MLVFRRRHFTGEVILWAVRWYCRYGISYRDLEEMLAETVIGLFKTEVIRRLGPWRSLEAVEFATLTWVDWFNHRRLLEPIGFVPPAEAETAFYDQLAGTSMAA